MGDNLEGRSGQVLVESEFVIEDEAGGVGVGDGRGEEITIVL